MATIAFIYAHIHISLHFPSLHVTHGLGESGLLADFLLVISGDTSFMFIKGFLMEINR